MKIYEKILSNEPLLFVPPTEDNMAVRQKIIDTTFSIVEEIEGLEKRKELEKIGLSKLHKILHAKSLPTLVKKLNDKLELEVFQWAERTCRKQMEFPDNFFLDHKIYFRINFPFIDALNGQKPKMQTDNTSEYVKQSFFDKVSSKFKKLFSLNKEHVSYDLISYNRSRPRTAWAHGPHIDTWYGHSYDAINFWWNITGVEKNNSMILYPDSHKKSFKFNPAHMYLHDDQKVPNPKELTLEEGALLLFDAELLHSTRLNTSDSTRFVVTIRVCPKQPTFSKKTQHSIYDVWHLSSNLRNGILKPQKVGTRVPDRNYQAWPAQTYKTKVIQKKFEDLPVHLGNINEFKEPTLVKLLNKEVLIVHDETGYFAVGSRCPHVGAPLAAGVVSPGKIQCPAHGVEFCLKTGTSECSKLKILTYPITLNNDSLLLEVSTQEPT